MADAVDAYLDALALSDTLRERVVAIQQELQQLCPEELNGAFISDYMDAEGVRIYESLWFFSDHFALEAKRFLTHDDYDVARFAYSVTYVHVTKEAYAFDADPTPASRMTLDCNLDTTVELTFKAAGINCGFLLALMLDRLIPQLRLA